MESTTSLFWERLPQARNHGEKSTQSLADGRPRPQPQLATERPILQRPKALHRAPGGQNGPEPAPANLGRVFRLDRRTTCKRATTIPRCRSTKDSKEARLWQSRSASRDAFACNHRFTGTSGDMGRAWHNGVTEGRLELVVQLQLGGGRTSGSGQ